jgi:hypothetical protein
MAINELNGPLWKQLKEIQTQKSALYDNEKAVKAKFTIKTLKEIKSELNK